MLGGLDGGEGMCRQNRGGPCWTSLGCPSLNPWTPFDEHLLSICFLWVSAFLRANSVPVSAHSWDRGPVSCLSFECSVCIWALYLGAILGGRDGGHKPQGVRNPQQISHSVNLQDDLCM